MAELPRSVRERLAEADRPKVDWALQHAANGYPVHPLLPLGKRPITLHGFKEATTDPDQIRRWWAATPDANIGIATEGLVVIDVDPKNDGIRAADSLTRERGPLSPIVVLTGDHGGARGRHHYYRPGTTAVRISVGKLAPGIDIRADGGYVVAPGSTHKSGVTYEGDLPTRGDLPTLPGWVTEALEAPGESRTGSDRDNAPIRPIEAFRGLPSGSRDDGLFRYSSRLRTLGLDIGEAAVLLEVAHGKIEQPDGDRIEWTATRAMLDRVWATYPSGPAGPEGPGAALRELTVYTSQQLKDLPPPEFLIDSLVPRDGLTFLYGAPGSAKSFVALDWAVSVGTGERWLGYGVHRGTALYVAAEGRAGLGQRVEGWEAGHGGVVAEGVVWLPEAINLLQASAVGALLRLVQEHQPVLIVIDTLARSLAGGDENSAKDTGLAIAAADRLREASGGGRAAVVIVHHTTKGGPSMRGSSALLGAADATVWARKNGTGIRLTNMKQKDAEEARDIRARLTPAGPSAALTGAGGAATLDAAPPSRRPALAAVVAAFSATPATKAQLRDVITADLGCNKATAYRAINDLLGGGFLTQQGLLLAVTEKALQAVAEASHATEPSRRSTHPSPGGAHRSDATREGRKETP